MKVKSFWRLHPEEFWLLAAARKQEKRYGSLTESEVSELYEELERNGTS